jgi:hypothetical protein
MSNLEQDMGAVIHCINLVARVLAVQTTPAECRSDVWLCRKSKKCGYGFESPQGKNDFSSKHSPVLSIASIV